MYYLMAIISACAQGFTPILKKNYVKNLRKVKLNGDIYLLVNIAAAVVYFFILAGGKVPLNVPTFAFSAVYAFLGFLSVIYSLIVFNHASVVYITVMTGSLATIIPFLYELIFTDIVFSPAKIVSVFCRVAAICVMLIFSDDKRISVKGMLLCIISGVINGLSGVVVRMYARAPGVLADGSFFFWTNVITLPIIFVNILRKANAKELADDFKKIKPINYVFALGGMLVGNAVTFVSIEIMRHISGTVYSVINGSISLIASAIISVAIYKEDVSAKTYISVLISIVAVVLSLI